jgi:hypothetical protein
MKKTIKKNGNKQTLPGRLPEINRRFAQLFNRLHIDRNQTVQQLNNDERPIVTKAAYRPEGCTGGGV